MPVAQFTQLCVAFLPVDRTVLLFGESARIANAFGIEVDGLLLAVLSVLVFNRGVRSLIRDDASAAESNLQRQAISGGLGDVAPERREIDITMTRVLEHRSP